MNSLQKIDKQLSLDLSMLTPEDYVENYLEFLPRYISKGHPTADTMTTYQKLIDQFIGWCREHERNPLFMHDYQMRVYVEWLFSTGHSQSGVSSRVTAIRAFFDTAVRLGLLKENPCRHIRVGTPYVYDEQFKYFQPDQIKEIYKTIQEDKFGLKRLRNEAIFLVMAVEGLRVVEVSRMNEEDIDWDSQSIYIHGKGHNGVIYPSEVTMKKLYEWIRVRPIKEKEGGRTPVFVSLSNRNSGERIDRNGIRKTMDQILNACGYKQKGISCHVFRHSCGTNLYAKTKDLRVVQETLRQRDPKVTARYAHVQQRMEKRFTSALTKGLEDPD